MEDYVPHLKPIIFCIKELGHTHGFFVEPDKSQFVPGPGVSEDAERAAKVSLDYRHMQVMW